MGLFGSVSGKEVDRFAKSLADDVSKQYPPALDKGGERTLSEKRLTRILEEVCNKAPYSKTSISSACIRKPVWETVSAGSWRNWAIARSS